MEGLIFRKRNKKNESFLAEPLSKFSLSDKDENSCRPRQFQVDDGKALCKGHPCKQDGKGYGKSVTSHMSADNTKHKFGSSIIPAGPDKAGACL